MFASKFIVAAAFAALSLAASQASAQSGFEPLPSGASLVRLASPLATPVDPVLDGRIWHCDGADCRSASFATVSGRSLVRQCENLARKVGVVESYRVGSETLAAADLALCNAVAKGAPVQMAEARSARR